MTAPASPPTPTPSNHKRNAALLLGGLVLAAGGFWAGDAAHPSEVSPISHDNLSAPGSNQSITRDSMTERWHLDAQGGRFIAGEPSLVLNGTATYTLRLTETPYSGQPWRVVVGLVDGSGGRNPPTPLAEYDGVVSPASLAFNLTGQGIVAFYAAQDTRGGFPYGNSTIQVDTALVS